MGRGGGEGVKCSFQGVAWLSVSLLLERENYNYGYMQTIGLPVHLLPSPAPPPHPFPSPSEENTDCPSISNQAAHSQHDDVMKI